MIPQSAHRAEWLDLIISYSWPNKKRKSFTGIWLTSVEKIQWILTPETSLFWNRSLEQLIRFVRFQKCPDYVWTRLHSRDFEKKWQTELLYVNDVHTIYKAQKINVLRIRRTNPSALENW